MTKYKPDDIFLPPGFRIYYSTLGKCEYEEIATYIIAESQKAGKWVAVEKFPADKVDSNYIDGLLEVQYLEKTKDGYMLTDICIEQIARKYPKPKPEKTGPIDDYDDD